MPVIMSEGSETECIHLLDPRSCATCQHGVQLPKVVKPRKKRKKPSKVAPTDLAEKYLMEYLSGARCIKCDGLRAGAAYQCDCERRAIADKHLVAINDFQDRNPDLRGKLVQTACSGAISRVMLRAGLRNTPSPVDGLSLGSLVGLANRVSNGRAMEWRQNTKGGDELPV